MAGAHIAMSAAPAASNTQDAAPFITATILSAFTPTGRPRPR